MANPNLPNLNGSGGSTKSKVDLLSGKHTKSILVAILFIITFIGLLILVSVKTDTSESLITGLVGILGMLAGFFVGANQSGKEDE